MVPRSGVRRDGFQPWGYDLLAAEPEDDVLLLWVSLLICQMGSISLPAFPAGYSVDLGDKSEKPWLTREMGEKSRKQKLRNCGHTVWVTV